jgi:hypothetical protein
MLKGIWHLKLYTLSLKLKNSAMVEEEKAGFKSGLWVL